MQLKVFISSRLEELEEERAAVEEAVSELWTHEKLPFTIWRWESAKEIPSGKHPDKVQSEGVRDSDIYVLILGSEYGDFEYGQSPTHKEYDTACSKLEEDCILIYIKEVEGREEKIEKWIEEIKDNKHTPKPFKNPYQLKDLVKTRLRDLWDKGIWKVNIPTIQSVLKKGETFEGDFFKKEPEWIDFEKGFVVEREETDDVIKKLENDNIQLVLGEPASGKSVILKNIGFKLAKENKDVYVVELKKHSIDEVKCYFDDIPKIKDEKAVFIVDDAHFLTTECEKLVREFKNRNLKEKLLIGSRPTREIRGEHPKEASVFEHLSKTYIHAEDVTEEIIKGFLKKEYHSSDERIKTVSKNLERYKKDLWHLSWALKAYKPEKDLVGEKDIYEKIRDSIRNISAGEGKQRINAEDIFLPLSVFYRFEIPIERKFLEVQLEIEENKITQLIELLEIIETEELGRNRMLSLIHSSIAELYFKTYQAYPSLGEKVKDKILNKSNEDLQYCLFYNYITSTDPRNAVDVVIRFTIYIGKVCVMGVAAIFSEIFLGKEKVEKSIRGDTEKEDEAVTLFEKLLGDKKVEKAIKEGIEKEENVEKIVMSM
jgi:transposase-like protein